MDPDHFGCHDIGDQQERDKTYCDDVVDGSMTLDAWL